MSRKERRIASGMRGNNQITGGTWLDSTSLIEERNDDLAVWNQQLKGYTVIHQYSQALTGALIGLQTTLRLTEYDIRATLTTRVSDPEMDQRYAEIQAGFSRTDKQKYRELMNPLSRFFQKQTFTDDSLEEIHQEFYAGRLPMKDFLSLLRTYSFEMKETMRVYVKVLTPEKPKKQSNKHTKHSQNFKPRTKPTIDEDSQEITPDPASQTSDAKSSIPNQKPFLLEGRTIHYTTEPWLTKPEDLVKLDTTNREAYMAQMHGLIAGTVPTKTSSVAHAFETAFNPEVYEQLKKTRFKHPHEGIDEGWLRLKRQKVRMGLLPIIEEEGLPVEAIICVGLRPWVYDRVSR